MLFIAHKPTHLHLVPEHRIILTTHAQIVFTHLHFIQEYLTLSLAETNPRLLEYSHQRSEALVGSDQSIELYWTDWQHQVQLRLYVCLNSESLYSLEYCEGWCAFGEFQQYSPRLLRLWKTQNAAEQYESCFLGHLQYVITRKHLVMFDHWSKQRTNIQWQQSEEYFKEIQRKGLQLKAFRLNESTVLLQANNFLLYINNNIVLKALSHPGVLSVTGSVVAWLELCKIRLYSIEQDSINFHGECDSFEGQYYGAILEESAIVMLFYEFKELKVKSIRLVHEEQNIRFCQQRKKKRKFKERYSQNLAIFQKLRQQAVESETIPEASREIHSATFRINGKTIKEALKESIGKFKEQFDKSHQEEKYNQGNPQSLHPNDQVQTREDPRPSYYELENFKSDEDIKDSFGGNQASREQQYDFNQDIKGLNSHHIISHRSSVASNPTHTQEVVETPAFRMLQHNNDHWNTNSWLVYEEKSLAMNPIIEETDPEQPQSPESIIPIQQTEPKEQQSAVDIEILETNKGGSHHPNSWATEPKIGPQPLRHSFFPKPQDCRQLNQSSFLKKAGQDPRASCFSNRSSRKKRILSSYIGGSHKNSNSNDGDEADIFGTFPTKQRNTQVIQGYDEANECFLRNVSTLKDQFFSQPDEQTFNKSKVFKPSVEPEVKRYTRILAQLYRSQPQKFEEELQKNVGSIIQEKEARLFFAEHIRNFNSNMTKDKLIRLYSFIEDTPQNRALMTEALSEFKLDEVPSSCLSFQTNFIDIFRLIYPKIYIEDLLQPSSRAVEELITNYLKIDFSDKRVEIEGVRIELQYPRNLLNILLYVNEWLKQPLQTIFELYTKHLLKHNCSSVIAKIVQSHIPQLCSIDTKVFEEAAQKALRELLDEKTIDYTVAEKILPFLSPEKKPIFNEIINLSEDFSVRGIIFDIKQLIDLPDKKDYVGFLEDVISCNNSSELAQITMPSLLTQLQKISWGKAKNHYTNDGIEITKKLSEKLIEKGFVSQSFYNLSTVAPVLKRAYIAALLFRHCKGIYANRLANTQIYTSKDFIALFKELLFKGPRAPDDLPQHALSQFGTDKTWGEFNSIAIELLRLNCWELRYLIYTDLDLASDLVEEQIITKSELEACCKTLGYFLSSPKKMFASHKVQECLLRLGSESAPSNNSGELFLVVKEDRKRPTRQKSSLRGSENKNNQDYLSKSLFASEEDTDPVLFDIKFSVVPDESIHILNEYYLQSSTEEFFDALKLVDHQKIGIKQQSISKFKAVYQQDLNYNFKSLVPFEYFFDRAQAWKKTAQHLYEFDVNDFWVVYLLVDLLYGTGIEVVQILINKVIRYIKDDSWSKPLQAIIGQFELNRSFLLKAVADAQERGLVGIQAVLERKLSI